MHKKAEQLKIPTLAKGKMFMLKDAPGCINSGCQPKIVNSNYGMYFVGKDLAVDSLKSLWLSADIRRRSKLPRVKVPGLNESATKLTESGQVTARAFKTRAPAVKFFREIASKWYELSDAIMADYESAKTKSQSADPAEALEGALGLMEH